VRGGETKGKKGGCFTTCKKPPKVQKKEEKGRDIQDEKQEMMRRERACSGRGGREKRKVGCQTQGRPHKNIRTQKKKEELQGGRFTSW